MNSSSARGTPTVLVVDDSNTMRASVAMTLEMGGMTVVQAQDGAQALALIQGGLRPDLILTDIMMPKLDGLGLIRQARQQLRFTPIVALTTQTQEHLKDQARALGVTAWMLKPTGGEQLLKQVRRFLELPTADAGRRVP